MNQDDKQTYGTKSKKQIRRLKAKERYEEFEKLSDEEKEKRIDENQQAYKKVNG